MRYSVNLFPFSRAELVRLVSSVCLELAPSLLPRTEPNYPTRAIIQKHINDCLQRAEDKVDWLLQLEDKPFSLNNHYLADYKAKFLSYYKGAREKDEQSTLIKAIQAYNTSASSNSNSFFFSSASSKPANTFSFATPPAAAGTDTQQEAPPSSFPPLQPSFPPLAQTGMAKVLAGLAELGVVGVKPEDIPKLLPPDQMEPALVIMADVRAYFQGSYIRIRLFSVLLITPLLFSGIQTFRG